MMHAMVLYGDIQRKKRKAQKKMVRCGSKDACNDNGAIHVIRNAERRYHGEVCKILLKREVAWNKTVKGLRALLQHQIAKKS